MIMSLVIRMDTIENRTYLLITKTRMERGEHGYKLVQVVFMQQYWKNGCHVANTVIQ